MSCVKPLGAWLVGSSILEPIVDFPKSFLISTLVCWRFATLTLYHGFAFSTSFLVLVCTCDAGLILDKSPSTASCTTRTIPASSCSCKQGVNCIPFAASQPAICHRNLTPEHIASALLPNNTSALHSHESLAYFRLQVSPKTQHSICHPLGLNPV
jgi:hypothetical protein